MLGLLGDKDDVKSDNTLFGYINNMNALIGTKDSSALDEIFGRIGSTSVVNSTIHRLNSL